MTVYRHAPENGGMGIHVEDFGFWYGDFHALSGATMDVAPNKITAFIGPSGCGKSTFLLGVTSKGDLDDIVEESLKRSNLWKEVADQLDKNGLALSGGQQQRLCIARTLAVQPDVLLMDEPCSAIDPTSVQRVEDLMAELSSEMTIIIVTHSMQQAARISDYMAFFLQEHAGEPAGLVEYGDTNEIFNSPSDQRTEDYITGRFG